MNFVNEPWYVFTNNYGTNEEKLLVKYLNQLLSQSLKQKDLNTILLGMRESLSLPFIRLIQANVLNLISCSVLARKSMKMLKHIKHTLSLKVVNFYWKMSGNKNS